MSSPEPPGGSMRKDGRRGELQVPMHSKMPWFEAPEVENHKGTVISACGEKVLRWVWSDEVPRPKYSLSKVTSSTFDPTCGCQRCESRKPSGRYLEPGVPIPPGQEWMIARNPDEPLKPFVRSMGTPRDARSDWLPLDAPPGGSQGDAQQDECDASSSHDQVTVDQLLRHGAWCGLRADVPPGPVPDAPGTVVGDGEEFSDPEDDPCVGQEWLLKQGLSVVSVPEREGSPEKWTTEEYQVRPGIVRDIMMRLKVEPQVDRFANENNHQLPEFSLLGPVVKKLQKDGAKTVLICPDWRTTWFWKAVQKNVLRRCYYAKGSKIFQLPGKHVADVKWGVWAYYVDGAIDNGCEEEMFEPNRVVSGAELDGTVQNSKSRRRRSRRKRQAEEDEEEEC